MNQKQRAIKPKRAKMFGALLRHRRVAMGKTISRLSFDARMDVGVLSRIERGLLPPPELIPFADRLIRALGFERTTEEYLKMWAAASAERFGDEQLPCPFEPNCTSQAA